MSKAFVLDACALVALLKNEEGADVVAAVYKQAENGEATVMMNRVNLLEVYYGFYHSDGEEYADKIMEGVAKSIVAISEFDSEIFTAAGRLKASYRISLADSIALAQALVSGGELVTSDHHEFDPLDGKESIVFCWIR